MIEDTPLLLRFCMGVVLCAAIVAPAAAASSIFGVWRNPKNSVHLEIRPCETGTCGYVVWANSNAREDARKGSGKELVGMQLLRGFTPDERGTWRGKVFVPDLNRTISGSAQLVDDRTLKAKGCFVANVLCKSQTWTRIEGQPG
jgi:uncharacterized protein (DUF2147 family)